MASFNVRPVFDAIPDELINPSYPDNPTKQNVERRRYVRGDLKLLSESEEFNSYAPYCWGYTIYRVVFGDGSDARFAEGLRRFEDWMRWGVRNNRYRHEDAVLWKKHPDCRPSLDERDATDDLAERLWNEVIQDYADADELVTGPEGSEDFSPIGRAFASWVESLNVNTSPSRSRKNARYDHCLIIDETALQTLERLPEKTPPVAPRDRRGPEAIEYDRVTDHTWVWILDRETAQNRERGIIGKFPPWIRIRLRDMHYLWFMRALGRRVTYWEGVVEEDEVKWEQIFWWNSMANAFNEVRRAHRAQASPPS